MTPEEFAAIRPIFTDVQEPVIVELGAYHGEESSFFHQIVNPQDLTHILVEPDPVNFSLITNGNKRTLINAAIWSSPGLRNFHCSKERGTGVSGSGSLRVPTGHIKHFPDILFESVRTVDCITLDQIFYWQKLTKVDLLWADIQGAEREMIQGGQKTLSQTRYLFMEVEDVELYADQALKPQLIAMLSGWEVVQDFGFNVLMRNTALT